jgi:hypothetical protein
VAGCEYLRGRLFLPYLGTGLNGNDPIERGRTRPRILRMDLSPLCIFSSFFIHKTFDDVTGK